MIRMASANTFYVPSSPHEGWAYICLCDKTGLVAIHSDYGSFAHVWLPAYRNEHLYAFLKGLNRDYFMGKMMGRDWMVPDTARMAKSAKQIILRARRDKEIDYRTAREDWWCADAIEGCSEIHEIVDAISTAETIGNFLWEQDIPYRPDQLGTRFWNEVWLKFVAALPNERWSDEGAQLSFDFS